MVSLKNQFLFFQILSIIVETDPENAALPNVMDCRFGRSNHSNIHNQFILRITNELAQKLKDFLCNVPIWMDCNCGRFFNSNSPPKSQKLYSPIFIDSNDSQFNMWNDFDGLAFANIVE